MTLEGKGRKKKYGGVFWRPRPRRRGEGKIRRFLTLQGREEDREKRLSFTSEETERNRFVLQAKKKRRKKRKGRVTTPGEKTKGEHITERLIAKKKRKRSVSGFKGLLTYGKKEKRKKKKSGIASDRAKKTQLTSRLPPSYELRGRGGRGEKGQQEALLPVRGRKRGKTCEKEKKGKGRGRAPFRPYPFIRAGKRKREKKKERRVARPQGKKKKGEVSRITQGRKKDPWLDQGEKRRE